MEVAEDAESVVAVIEDPRDVARKNAEEMHLLQIYPIRVIGSIISCFSV